MQMNEAEDVKKERKESFKSVKLALAAEFWLRINNERIIKKMIAFKFRDPS
jgi:hypothetical protein